MKPRRHMPGEEFHPEEAPPPDRRWLLWLLFAAVFLIVLVAGVIWWRGRPRLTLTCVRVAGPAGGSSDASWLAVRIDARNLPGEVVMTGAAAAYPAPCTAKNVQATYHARGAPAGGIVYLRTDDARPLRDGRYCLAVEITASSAGDAVTAKRLFEANIDSKAGCATMSPGCDERLEPAGR
jgi:uncharacterized membrane protein